MDSSMDNSFCGDSPLWIYILGVTETCCSNRATNMSMLLNSTWPQLTMCFQSTVLVVVPNGYLWCAALPYLAYISCTASCCTPLPSTRSNVAKTVLSVLLSLMTIVAILSETGPATNPYPTAHYIARFFEGITYILAAVLTQVERKHGYITSGVLFVYWLQLTIVDIVPLYSYIMIGFISRDMMRVLIFIVSYMMIVAQLCLQACVADLPHGYTPGDCPETKAPFLSRITFCWMTRLIISGFRKPLQAADLWRLNPRDKSATVVPLLECELEKAGAYSLSRGLRNQGSITGRGQTKGQCQEDEDVDRGRNNNGSLASSTDDTTCENMPLLATHTSLTSYSSLKKVSQVSKERDRAQRDGPRFSLYKVMFKTYFGDVFISYLCKLVSDLLQYLGPLLLGALIAHLESPADPSWKGYVVAALMLGASWSQTSFYHQHYHVAMTTGMRMKTGLMAAVYKKSVRLNTDGQREGTVGEVVNLMAVDCQAVQDMMSYTWMIWSIPLQVSIAVYLLWDTMGMSVLAGVGLLVLLVPINGYMAFKQQKLRKENLLWKDKRLKIMNEIINGIKVLKLYAWEASFQDRVMSLRKKEVNILTKAAYLNAFSIFLWTCAPYLVTLATFATYILSDDDARLDASKAFVTLSLFNILQFPIAFVPEMISFTAQASVSIKRIEQFLQKGELDPSIVVRSETADSAIRIERGLFAWDSKAHSTLHGINLDVTEGELVAVVGNVGSGKSSLISAILGEMEKRQGKVVVKGSIAYVPQQAWIQNAALKNNILFGKQFNHKWYKKVIDACALRADLNILSDGDHTEIGEKGINLSGGQKQRVSLARAVYANNDVYIFDDPLSAVDSHVGKHIFRKIMSDKGILKHKTRLLVTHAVHWLPLVDTVVLIQDGRIVESGSYLQLMRRNGPLAQFLQAVLVNADDTETEDDPEVLELRRRMMEHVESVTSTSEGGTSGDEYIFHRHRSSLLSSANTQPDSPSASIRRNNSTSFLASRLTEEEEAATGTVKMKVFSSYASHVGKVWCVVIMIMFCLYQMSSIMASFWLSDWTQDSVLLDSNISTADVIDRNHYYLLYYGIFGVGQAVFVSLYAWIAAVRMTRAAASIHAKVLENVFRSPMSFFDTTPSGRIVNRFARDVETVDSTLPQIVFMFVMCVFSVLSTLIVISVTTPVFMSVIVPLAIGYYALQRFFVPTSRQLKRLEAVTRSPIFTHFSETLTGVTVIRAFQATERFIREALERMDKNQIFYFAGITANRWLGVWIEVVSSCVVFAATVFALLTPSISSGEAGLSITYALQITQALKWLVRTISDLETNVVSVERLQEYSELKSEAPRVMSLRPRMNWPSHGNIIFTNYSTRYRPGLDLVIKNVNINIKGGEKVGIVGRTGAGKSSLTLALFRLLEPSTGTITIDGLDTTSLGLQDLRSRLTVLPQDPVLFSGSLRMNLDPFGQFSDRELWDSLQLAHLLSFVRDLPQGLEYDCGEGGKNLSVGQCQLVCLARGLLRKTRILVLDEPTAAVDPETDILIQGTIRRDFSDCTTITIAHRLNTIMDYDRVLVLDEGLVKEFDKPSTLLQNPNSLFFSLAVDAGLVLKDIR